MQKCSIIDVWQSPEYASVTGVWRWRLTLFSVLQCSIGFLSFFLEGKCLYPPGFTVKLFGPLVSGRSYGLPWKSWYCQKRKRTNTKVQRLLKAATKSELKKQNKDRSATPESFRYVSKLLRSRIRLPSPESLSKDYDQEIVKNFWHYSKKFIEIPSRVLPEFDKQKWNKYFRKSLAAVNPTKLLAIPDWLPKFNDPSVEFDLSPPTNNKTCKIVKRMEALGSPCPLDQISIIYFKRCSICRFVLEICKEVLRRKSIPKSWQRAATILIYKKGDKSDPSNFRPITLESVMLKIFTLLIRDRVFEFLHRINI